MSTTLREFIREQRQLVALNDEQEQAMTIGTQSISSNIPENLTKENILDEESYVDALEHIITRDFYPDVFEARRKQLYEQSQARLSTQEMHKRNGTEHTETREKVTSSFDDIETPSRPGPNADVPNDKSMCEEEGEEACSIANSQVSQSKLGYVNGDRLSSRECKKMRGMSLNEFQAQYTSEDNASFKKLLYQSQLQHFEKYKWILDQQLQHEHRCEQLELLKYTNSENDWKQMNKSVSEIMLAIANGSNETMAALPSPQGQTGNDNSKDMTTTTTMSLLPAEKSHKDQIKAKLATIEDMRELYKGELEFWKFQPINSLLFYPEEVKRNTDSKDPSQARFGRQTSLDEKDLGLSFLGKSAPECIYENTRFPKGFKVPIKTDPNSNPNFSMTENQTPQINGYSLVKTPQIVPGGANDASDTPIVTWGNIADTPMLLDDENRPKEPIFKVPAVPKRDQITNALSKKNAEKLRAKEEAKRIATTPRHLWNYETPMTNASRIGTGKTRSLLRMRSGSSRARTIDELSPAARKLMEGKTGGKTPLFRPSTQRKGTIDEESNAHNPMNTIIRRRSSSTKWSRVGSSTSNAIASSVTLTNLKHTPIVTSNATESQPKARKLNSGIKQKGPNTYTANLKNSSAEVKIGQKRNINQANLTDGLL
ncbi:hypothetical protein RFI_11086 [Reticulomyxa filosa]|uniref:Uncharacterized protein n=1 Tax=Reticulomyxa filosa TaxID=46433 RepID=X6NIA1_RETFI|nr:hypothetical protein RFI_11086 [Reticulomyxa filosa]|eukprot:ETO26050.1 hypothetical protein RFI_11086 [Reticulomyxa filosa]